jgi:tetratricopeptide (TPR) repeat protein
MKAGENINDIPSADEIRAALARIVVSPAFAQSPQLVAFLRFVVEAVLAGRASSIKSYAIAVEALGRSESFDPANDAIVRVEAGRLRKALARYYSGTGAKTVIIEMNPGSYIPIFHRRKIRRMARLAARLSSQISGKWGRWSVTGLLLLIAIGVGALMLAVPSLTLRDPTATATVGGPSAGKDMPIVFVQTLDAVGAPAEAAGLLTTLPRKLRDAFAHFDELDVASEIAPQAGTSLQRTDPQAPARSQYRLGAALEYNEDGTATLSFRLHDVSDGTVAWTRAFENIRLSPERIAAENEIVRKVAITMAQPYGVIHARELAKLAGVQKDGRYRCLLQAIEFRRNDDPVTRERVRACLEHATRSDPVFAGGFAALAMLAIRDYYDDLGRDSVNLDRPLGDALRAVELRPQSARAHQALMNVLFARGEISAALAEGEKAISLNSYDMTVLIAYGMRLAASGNLEKGTALLYQAAAETPVRPPILNFALFLSAYLLGDESGTSYHAALLTSETYPFALLARALAAAQAGDRDRARQIIEKLLALRPDWHNDVRKRLERLIPSSALVDRIIGPLAAAGMAVGGH